MVSINGVLFEWNSVEFRTKQIMGTFYKLSKAGVKGGEM